jgi:outer membrane protein OmpA-like peptidoglycan-associated protein
MATVGAGFGGEAFAQDGLELDVQTFRPAAGPYSIFTVETSKTLGHLEPTGSVILNYASEPLLLAPEAGGEDVAIIDQQLAMHVVAGVGLFERGQIDLEIPVYFVNSSDFDDNIESGVIGDMSIRPKYTFLSPDEFPVGLSGALDVTLPTGNEASLVGDSSVEVAPRVIADHRYQNVIFAANLGVRFQENTTIRNVELGERLEYGVGAEAEFLHGLLRLGGELYGRTELGDPFGNADEAPVEGLLGAKVVTDSGFSIMAGAGGGIVGGIGAPEFRTFLGLRYAFMETDADQDGVRDVEDQCPDEREDIDGYEDADGCPDPDNDDDGVPDLEDECPQAAGAAENDGCPELEERVGDSDGDGVPDPIDECPQEQGTRDNVGCPPEAATGDVGADVDGDGIADADGDGIADADDLCPEQPEDKDGFDDEDGCPDTDNDRDGILDSEDECPNEPGLEANQGCAPQEQKAVREDERIKITEKVFFETDKAVIKPESYNLLQQVALVIRSNPDIDQVEIAGHTDQKGSPAYNQRLAEARAQAVRTFLVEEANVSADRLVAKGYGDAEPLVESAGEQSRAQNRRVEFRIMDGADEAVDDEAGDEEPADEN